MKLLLLLSALLTGFAGSVDGERREGFPSARETVARMLECAGEVAGQTARPARAFVRALPALIDQAKAAPLRPMAILPLSPLLATGRFRL